MVRVHQLEAADDAGGRQQQITIEPRLAIVDDGEVHWSQRPQDLFGDPTEALVAFVSRQRPQHVHRQRHYEDDLKVRLHGPARELVEDLLLRGRRGQRLAKAQRNCPELR